MILREKILCGLCWLAVLGSVTACSNTTCPTDIPRTAALHINGHKLSVEIAATPSERSCGLAFRQNLPGNQGMLFVYPDVGIREFWMKNTRMPLDLAYLAETGRVTEIYQMSPSDPEQRYRSGQSVAFALEVNRGWFEAHDVNIGDTITIQIPESVEIR